MQHKLIQKTRNLEFDILKGLAIFLVICGHAISGFSSDTKTENDFYLFIYAFHMPLFMLISGFFSANSLNLPIKDILNKKFWQLIFPTIAFGILYFIFNILFLEGGLKSEFIGFIDGLWFLKSCFLCYFILGCCLKINKGNKLWGCVLALLISQAVPFFKITYMLPFFVIGYLFSNYKINFYKNTLGIFLLSTACFIIIFLIYRELDLNKINLRDLKSSLLEGDSELLKNYSLLQLMRLGLGISGALMVIYGVIYLCRHKYLKFILGVFSVYGKYTLGIYIIQTFLLEMLMSRYVDLSKIDVNIYSYIVIPLLSWIIMEICNYIVKGLNNSSIGRFMFEGKLNKIVNSKSTESTKFNLF